ncbi:MAG: YitT family protein [Eubacteriales bacterium]|nr:YitT family protein [Eubacteriales bacterium]
MTKQKSRKRRGLWHQEGILPPLKDIILLFIGSLISAMAINIFYVPTRLTMGGATGIAMIIYQVALPHYKIPLGLLILVLNIPIFILGIKKISRTFAWRSLIGTVFFSLIIDLTAPLMSSWFKAYIDRPLQTGNADPLLYCVFGGVLFGLGVGIIFRAGFTTGGTDIIAILIKRKYKTFSTGQFLMILDAVIVMTSAVIYRNATEPGILLAMYSFIAMYLTAKSVDIMLEGFEYTRTAYIISDHSQEIARRILADLSRGVTSLAGRGMYTGKDKDVLLCVLSSKQVPDLKQIVEDVDENAFMIVVEAREVLGQGFGNGREI